jgi:hypothetical protein
MAESTINMSLKQFNKLMIEQEFGAHYLNHCPSAKEIKCVMTINAGRGFPGMLASWDCKLFHGKTVLFPLLDSTRERKMNSQLISVLRWMIELGRIDIYYKISLLSQYLALPRQGHLEAVYHVFTYLMKHDKSHIIFDLMEPWIDESQFVEQDWSDFYGDVKEELPIKMTDPLGFPVNMSVFVDANHTGNVVTHRFHTGILIFPQNIPVMWHSRHQNTVETSTFGSEFVAL